MLKCVSNTPLIVYVNEAGKYQASFNIMHFKTRPPQSSYSVKTQTWVNTQTTKDILTKSRDFKDTSVANRINRIMNLL